METSTAGAAGAGIVAEQSEGGGGEKWGLLPEGWGKVEMDADRVFYPVKVGGGLGLTVSLLPTGLAGSDDMS